MVVCTHLHPLRTCDDGGRSVSYPRALNTGTTIRQVTDRVGLVLIRVLGQGQGPRCDVAGADTEADTCARVGARAVDDGAAAVAAGRSSPREMVAAAVDVEPEDAGYPATAVTAVVRGFLPAEDGETPAEAPAAVRMLQIGGF